MESTVRILYQSCVQCPRKCAVSRTGLAKGFCHESDNLRIASACLHFGEEPPITAAGGSGTIFITGCNLRCAFCQNYQISQNGMGTTVSTEDFVRICLALQNRGAENINIVTGSHAVPLLAENLRAAKQAGLTIPICWNSSAYELPETLEQLLGVVDIWLPDLKTLNPFISEACFAAKDYPQRAKKAIRFMIEHTSSHFSQVTNPQTGKRIKKMLSGIIIRHLFLPGRMDDTILTLDWLKKNADGKACISLMSQYTPVPFPTESAQQREAALKSFDNRLVNQSEFHSLQQLITAYDFDYLFYQELETDTEWLPDFTRTQPFSNTLAKPVWHWKTGFITT